MSYTATLVTTTDNPFNPFDQAEDWNRFDKQNGYNTMSYMLRLAKLSDEMSTREVDDELSAVSKEIAAFNLTGNYKLVNKTITEND